MNHVIDGRHFSGPMGGVQRYIRELVPELDKLAEPGEYEVLVPPDAENMPQYKNIRVIHYGCFKGLLWEQICLPWYLLTKKKWGVFPCTIVPLLYPKGLVTIHDIMPKTVPEVRQSISSPIARMLLDINYLVAAKRTAVIVTPSEYSKDDIVKTYHIDPDKVHVAGSGWQHVLRMKSDVSWREKYPQLMPGEFFFALSANRKQKNFKWICEVAKRNPQYLFAIAGGQDEWQKQPEYSAKNIIHLGYVSDEEIRSLMENCRAFLFPSIAEGFGIPPLEALSLGVKAVVAHASCLPEIYENSVYYIDPYDYEVDLDRLLEQNVAPASEVLEKHSWEITAGIYHNLLKQLK